MQLKLTSTKIKRQKSALVWMLNDNDLFGCSPLHYASQEGNVTSLTNFLQHGLRQLSVKTSNHHHQSPLHFACLCGRYMACKKLLDTPQVCSFVYTIYKAKLFITFYT